MNRIIYILLLISFQSFSQNYGGKIIYNKNRSINQIQYSTNQTENLTYYKNNNVKSVIFSNNCNQLPIPTISGNGSFCFSDSTLLTCNTNNVKYIWSTGEKTKSIWVKTAGSYKVSVIYKPNCIKESVQFTVIVNQTPLPIVSNVSYCINSQANPLGATPSNNCSLIWYGTNAIGGVGSPNASVPSTSNIGTTNYYVSQKDNTTNCESARAQITVNINSSLNPPTVSNGIISICGSSTVNLNAVSIGNTIKWYTQPTGGNSIGTSFSGENFAVSVTSPISYYAETSSNSGCLSSNRTEIKIIIGASFNPQFNLSKSFGGTDTENVHKVIQTKDSGFLIIGESTSNDFDFPLNFGQYDIVVVKLDAEGNTLWKKNYGGSGGENALSVVENEVGDYYIIGNSSSNDGNIIGNHGENDVIILKINSSGNLIWQKSFGGSAHDFGNDLTLTNDGIIVGATTGSNDGNITNNKGAYDIWIFKIDFSGNIIWQKNYGGADYDITNKIKISNDGKIIVSGQTNSNNIDVSNNHGLNDYWVIKLDENGNKIWEKSIGGSNSEIPWCLSITKSNEIIIGGYTNSIDGDITSNQGEFDIFLTKLNLSGQIIWNKTIGGNGVDGAFSIANTNDDGFVITGSSAFAGGSFSDIWTNKFDKLGNIQWQYKFGGSGPDKGNSIIQSTNGDYYLVGDFYPNYPNFSINRGSSDMFLVKIPAEISITTLSSNMLCTGSNLIINYTVPQGFTCNNTFSALLSDGNGDFINAINIGSVNSSISGVINAQIPNNILSGSNYKIKVVASNLIESAEKAVTIKSLPTNVNVSGSGSYCSSATLTVTGGLGGIIYYQGIFQNGISLLHPTNSQVVNQTGIYYFRAYNECGWGQQSSANVVISSTENSWTGSVNNDWENPNNWSCGQIPNENTNVNIRKGLTNYPIISTVVKCKNMNFESISNVKIIAGGNLVLYK